MKYAFSITEAQQQFVTINAAFKTPDSETTICFPTWRPGRYEMGDFAKNVRYFKVTDENGKELNADKIDKSNWKINTEGIDAIKLRYQYYAVDMNAGSTYLDKTQLYVNPVNCCAFVKGTENEEVEVSLDIPHTWKVATSLKKNEGVYIADTYHELVDSPFICSAELQYNQYEVGATTFHIWFNGEVKPNWQKLIPDFKAFTELQIKKFTEFPTEDYHFLFQILPHKAYHGVEHAKSTVITLGPSYEVFEGLYTELLGVSSHELYHTWNVKTIRSADMMPYDYTKENFSKMGYLCEGVTTYMGDIMLYKSGVFDRSQYFKEFSAQLQKHFDNQGRFNYSVAESSWDTWLDGYVAGAPGRKVSIYTEGCLLAFVTDVMIMKHTDNKRCLDDVMRQLFNNFGMKGIGVTEEDYIKTVENVASADFTWLKEDYIHGIKGYEAILYDALEYLGIEMVHETSKRYSHGRLGFKTISKNGFAQVKMMYPGGSADMGGVMMDDIIVAVNNCKVQNDLDRWLNYFDDDIKTLTVERAGKFIDIILPEVQRNFYQVYGLKMIEKPIRLQEQAFNFWRK